MQSDKDLETRHGLKKNPKKPRSLKIGLNNSQKNETTFVIYKKIILFIKLVQVPKNCSS